MSSDESTGDARVPLKVLVAGGGIGGVTAALCLAARGHETRVFEQAATFGEVGAGIQLSPNCARVLHHLGLENRLRAEGCLPQSLSIRRWRTGAVIAESALGDEILSRFGFPYYHMHRADLMQALVDAASEASNVVLHCGVRVTGFEQNDDEVRLRAGGTNYTGDVLVGADGIHSPVRAGLWGTDRPRFTGNVAWRALVPADRLPAGMLEPVTMVWWGPGRHFVHYRVRGGDLVNCVCVVERRGWEVESWTERGEHSELKAEFEGWHEDIQRLLDNMQPDSLFKWALHDREPMARWGMGRVTLLGDACHPTLPFLAQGAAMAIEDAAVLAACLEGGDRAPCRLQRYEQLRRERTSKVQLGSRRNAAVFHLGGIRAWLRDRVVGFTARRTMDDLYGHDVFADVPPRQ